MNARADLSILRTVIMMLGETNGLNSFIVPYVNNTLHFGGISLLFLVVFILLVPILLTNLLVCLLKRLLTFLRRVRHVCLILLFE